MDAPPPSREPTVCQSAPEVPAYPAPLPDPVPCSAAQDETERKAIEVKEEIVTEEEIEAKVAADSLETSLAPSSTSNGVAEEEPDRPCSPLEDPLESPIAQPEELRLPNGLPLPAPQDPEAPVVGKEECDDSPIAEPEVTLQPVIATTLATQAAPTPPVEATPPPVDQSASAPVVMEVPAEPVAQAAPAQPEVHDTVPPVTLEVKETTPVPQSKEETPSTPEVDSIADNAPETVPTPPPTVTPVLVETTVQGQSPYTNLCISQVMSSCIKV